MSTQGVNIRARHEVYKTVNLRQNGVKLGTGNNQPTVTFEPKHLQRSVKRITNDPILTFKLEAFSGTLKGHIMVPQNFFLAETRTNIPQVLDFDEGDKIEYNFRALLNVSRRVKVDAEWEVFGYFIQWLHTGVYENFQIECTHVDAYILSKTLGSPRFGNAVMEVILATMPSRKFDQGLTKKYQQIFLNCEVECPLRILYFESAVYWKMSYGPKDTRYGGWATRGEGVLMLDVVEDEVLIEVLEKHRRNFCPCADDECEAREIVVGKRARSAGPGTSNLVGLDNKTVQGVCICKIAPWSRDRERFFIAT
ncbi:hypothetical protein DL98DRAFT_615171 [Cadophora sp. DSE1049]|nr:hypothetical protein DL98DRAFT_615171 [Cadophora sp. DSE1049]